MKFEINEKQLLVIQPDGSKGSVSFKWPIAQVLEASDVLIVRTKPEPNSCDNRNIFGITSEGTVLWQIAPQEFIYDDSPYTGMTVSTDGVNLFNWDGTDLLVEPITGKIISRSFGR